MNIQSDLIPQNEEQLPPEKKSNPILGFIRDLIQTAILAVILYLIINAVVGRIRIESISMQPTLYEGDLVLVNRFAYQIGEPKRGDVIVFHYPIEPEREPYIKRVIGLPGDRITISNEQVIINGSLIEEEYTQAEPSYQGEWIVPENELFVLGDNRNRSSDSHQWGMVPMENVMGRAEVVYYPIQHWQTLHQNVAIAAGE
jgi:signal peptidase I